MSEAFIIRGGKTLGGEISIKGSKNATLAILAASLLSEGKVTLRNVPKIGDVAAVLDIMRGLGSQLEQRDDTVLIDNSGLSGGEPNPELVRKIRGSVTLMGALLARFRKVKMPYPGGDVIGARSLDTHFDALRLLGAVMNESTNHLIGIEAPKGLCGAKIVLTESSVTATENTMLASSLAEGKTTIKLAATEPHVQDLAAFLKKLGIKVEGAGTHTIEIEGSEASRLAKEVEHEVIPDSDEAMNLAVLAAATRSDVFIKGVNADFLEDGLLKLGLMGVNFEPGNDFLHIKKPTGLYRAAKIQAGLYPKLMSDQLPPFAVLATQAQGTSLIHEWMYEGRLGYINELIKMGANAVIMDPHRALIVGPTPLHGAELRSLDIRSGMTTIIAGLVAEGETIINEAGIIDRGYERIEERLRMLGAEIKRVSI
jgi:UDP-N-acetylglucosamine 1-carboxyvinyltransferase